MLHLASKSPRRSELLARLGLPFGILDLDIPEQQGATEAAADYVRRVAREKAGAGLLDVVAVADAVVLGADTEVILDGMVFGKPADAVDAARSNASDMPSGAGVATTPARIALPSYAATK